MTIRPHVTSQAAQLVAALAQHQPGDLPLDPATQSRAESFVAVNGYRSIANAVAEVVERQKRGRRYRDPWLYSVELVNAEQVRGHGFQVLLHWVEIGLRARVDSTLVAVAGQADWHLSPALYLPPQAIANIGSTTLKRVQLVSSGGRRIPDVRAYPSAEHFLGDLDLGELRTIIDFCYAKGPGLYSLDLAEVECLYLGCRPFSQPVCCGQAPHAHTTGGLRRGGPTCKANSLRPGAVLMGSKVKSMLSSALSARNTVDHALLMTPNQYASAWPDIRHLALALGFDLRKATSRLEYRRLQLADEVLKAYGVPGGITDVAQGRPDGVLLG